jgi:hypothetical protein
VQGVAEVVEGTGFRQVGARRHRHGSGIGLSEVPRCRVQRGEALLESGVRAGEEDGGHAVGVDQPPVRMHQDGRLAPGMILMLQEQERVSQSADGLDPLRVRVRQSLLDGHVSPEGLHRRDLSAGVQEGFVLRSVVEQVDARLPITVNQGPLGHPRLTGKTGRVVGEGERLFAQGEGQPGPVPARVSVGNDGGHPPDQQARQAHGDRKAAGDVLRPIGRAVVGDQDFAAHLVADQKAVRLADAGLERLRLVEARHQDRQFGLQATLVRLRGGRARGLGERNGGGCHRHG